MGMTEDANQLFTRLRPRLEGIAYRMLGTLAEAEDVVQDAWLRWHEADKSTLDNPEAWLVSITTRRAIDKLRSAKVQREHYVGMWLPEPMLTDASSTPEQMQELSSDISVAFLTLLERLSPEARAAYLLREIFDADYDEVARTLDKSEAACRQIVHRAKQQLRDERPRQTVEPQRQLRLVRRFSEALALGSIQAMKALLAEDATLVGDGGGKVNSIGHPLLGSERIAYLYYATHRRYSQATQLHLLHLNGQWALLRYIDGMLESAQSYDTDGERILHIQVQRNPDKLARLQSTLQAAPLTSFDVSAQLRIAT